MRMLFRHNRVNSASVLALDPESDSGLAAVGFSVCVANSAVDATAAIRKGYFTAPVVVADLGNAACLDRLDELRREAPRCWMIVVSPQCDARTCNLIYRHGGDVCVAAPVSIVELTKRLGALQWRSRPVY
jgi:DNA-binding response OmpR family regulator